MILIGLGNPELKYENTPHNIGFDILDKIKEKLNFPSFVFDKKINAEISKGSFLLIKPKTFMNLSGKTVKNLLRKKYFNLSDIIIIHDDIDIEIGKYKISKNRGSAGHKGIESIIKEIGTKDFKRIRVGILPKEGKPKHPEHYVLKKFEEKEKKEIDITVENIINEILILNQSSILV